MEIPNRSSVAEITKSVISRYIFICVKNVLRSFLKADVIRGKGEGDLMHIIHFLNKDDQKKERKKTQSKDTLFLKVTMDFLKEDSHSVKWFVCKMNVIF